MSCDAVKLEPTAALVMAWSLPLYRYDAIRPFMDRLDLSAGVALRARCNAVCNWYGEVILNRKHCIRHLVEGAIRSGVRQVVILAAGKSPLALELLLAYPAGIDRIIEVDCAGMEEKQALYAAVAPGSTGTLRCVTADITLPDLLEELGDAYLPGVPTVVLMEGISYFITREQLCAILDRFRSPGRTNRLVIEHLLPCRCIAPERRRIPREVFAIVRDETGTPAPAAYTRDELAVLLGERGAILAHCTVSAMERHRTGSNRYFPHPEDGWIGCLMALI